MRRHIKQAVGDLIAIAEHEQLTVARFREGLRLIADRAVADPQAFAQALLDGATVRDAHMADVEALETPLSPTEQVIYAQGQARIAARREVVRAALKLERAEEDGKAGPYPPLFYPAWRSAEQALYVACKAFRDAGGDEVLG